MNRPDDHDELRKTMTDINREQTRNAWLLALLMVVLLAAFVMDNQWCQQANAHKTPNAPSAIGGTER